MSKYAIISDIHGNMIALQEVMKDLNTQGDIAGVILLGDFIDYGPQSNEVVSFLRDEFPYKILCNIWGNHERAIMLSDYSNFSSQRGVDSAKFTRSILTDTTLEYLDLEVEHSGKYEFEIDGFKVLAVHGSLEDYYWKSILPDNVRGDYSSYDIVLSGHSHYSHMFTKFYDSDNPKMRNKHKVLFINPGSVGQPRNHNNNAQYTILDTDTIRVDMRAVTYNIDSVIDLFDDRVDEFYKSRLITGV